MRTILVAFLAALEITGAAHADDAASRTSPTSLGATTVNWTGFYFGANAGYSWHNRSVGYLANDPVAQVTTCGGLFGGRCIPPASFRSQGGVVGGQLGYNLQLSPNWLVGLEADFDWGNVRGKGTSPFSLGSLASTYSTRQTISWLGTVRARIGFLPIDRLLVYATGGVAHADGVKASADLAAAAGGGANNGAVGFLCAGGGTNCFVGSISTKRAGWTLGAGAEYQLTSHVSIKAEYLYAQFGSLSVVSTTVQGVPGVPGLSAFTARTSRLALNMSRIGFNFRF